MRRENQENLGFWPANLVPPPIFAIKFPQIRELLRARGKVHGRASGNAMPSLGRFAIKTRPVDHVEIIDVIDNDPVPADRAVCQGNTADGDRPFDVKFVI